MMILHHGWRSSASRRVRLCLEEKGLAYESHVVDMANMEHHSPEYLKINPLGVIPTLIHDGRPLHESGTICEYLDESFPDPPLRPATPYERGEMRNWIRHIDGLIGNLIIFNWRHHLQKVAEKWSDEELAEKMKSIPSKERQEAWLRVARKPYTEEERQAARDKLTHQLLDRMEEALKASGWLVGKAYSIADIAAVPFVKRIDEEIAPEQVSEKHHPRVADWWARIQARPAFGRANIGPFVDHLLLTESSQRCSTLPSNEKSYADGKILKSITDGVGVVTFNNPEKRNAMSLEMWEGLGQALSELRDDPEVRVVVLVGAGDKAFVSGADISQFEKTRHNAAASEEYSKKSDAQRALLGNYPKPTIACIRGFCLGGGMQVAMLTDIRIAAEDSQFGIPAAKLGIAYGYDGLRNLVSLVGPSWARLIMYTGMRIDSKEALRIGLVDRVIPNDELWDATMEIARTISGNAPLAIKAAKITIAQVLKDPGRPRHGRDQADRHRLHGLRGFPRRPPRLHGKAQTPVQGKVASVARASAEDNQHA